MAGDKQVVPSWLQRPIQTAPVADYDVYRDGTEVATVTGTGYTDTG